MVMFLRQCFLPHQKKFHCSTIGRYQPNHRKFFLILGSNPPGSNYLESYCLRLKFDTNRRNATAFKAREDHVFSAAYHESKLRLLNLLLDISRMLY